MKPKLERFGKTYTRQSRSDYGMKRRLQELISSWKSPRSLATLLDGLPEEARLLDIGCGDGQWLQKLSAHRPDLDLHGLDICSGESEGYQHHVGRSDELPFEDNSIDACVCRHLVEHLPDPFPTIHEIIRILRPGGKLYLECPDVRSTRPFMHPHFWDDPTHLRPYTREALRRMTTICGLEVVNAGRVRNPWVVWLGPFYTPLALLFRDRHFLPAWIGQVFGVWIHVVARKPSG